jgi:hypothetical protein
MAKISCTLSPAAFSISSSLSTKGAARLSASFRPTVDLPTPIMPTSAIVRSSRRAPDGVAAWAASPSGST